MTIKPSKYDQYSQLKLEIEQKDLKLHLDSNHSIPNSKWIGLIDPGRNGRNTEKKNYKENQ